MTAALCTTAEIDFIWSSQGVEMKLDDDLDGTAEAGSVDQAIEWASAQIAFQLGTRYTVAQYQGASPPGTVPDWIKWATALLAAERIGVRRGMAITPQMIADRETLMRDLADVRAGRMDIPDVTAVFNNRPAVSNLRVNRAWPGHPIRRVQSASTGGQPHPDSGVKQNPEGTIIEGLLTGVT